jgi:hypothetical protein
MAAIANNPVGLSLLINTPESRTGEHACLSRQRYRGFDPQAPSLPSGDHCYGSQAGSMCRK